DDLAGRILEAEGDKRDGGAWEVIRLPALAELLDPLGRAPGDALWPEWEGVEQLERKRSIIGPRDWSALYQQRPTAEDGTYFKKEWFRTYTQAPDRLTIYMSGDFAVTEGGGDFTELAVWGVDPAGAIYALDWWAGQEQSDVWVSILVDKVMRWNPVMFIGETGQIRRAIEPMLRREMRERGKYVACEWLPHEGNKIAHASSMMGLMSAGAVFWPADPRLTWVERIINQLCNFTGEDGRIDDAVDACSLFARYIHKTWNPTVTKPAQPVDLTRLPTINEMMSPIQSQGDGW
ncbi:hypothetical protein K0U83_02475, partial [bacterium]|nr:hypothetical protein [bacterium]